MLLFLILGAAIGFALAGLPGAAIGALGGALLGRALLTTLFARGLDAVRAQFLDSTFAIMGAVCKADGRVSPDEIRAAERFFDRLSLSPQQRRSAQAAFNRGKASAFDLDGEVRRLRAVAGRSAALLQFFIEVQLAAAAADGVVDGAEHALLVRVARGLGLSAADIERLEAMLRGSAGGRGGTRDTSRPRPADAYAVLGVSPDASDAEVKRAYRRLMSKHHPDKLAARGMPENMRPVAEEKTREIRAAYDAITAERGG
jgi:DnaJ like chaperone protein